MSGLIFRVTSKAAVYSILSGHQSQHYRTVNLHGHERGRRNARRSASLEFPVNFEVVNLPNELINQSITLGGISLKCLPSRFCIRFLTLSTFGLKINAHFWNGRFLRQMLMLAVNKDFQQCHTVNKMSRGTLQICWCK